MPPIDLNIEFDYSIEHPYVPSDEENASKAANLPTLGEDWSCSQYSNFKTNLKREHLRQQNDRCAYCRNYVEPDGNYEPIEHIVAKSIKPTWMLEVKNLVVTCDRCNNSKNDAQTLTPDHINDINFPDDVDAFSTFNPHYERWRNHFQIENEIFLTAVPNSKGEDTIRICKLYQYYIPINNARLIRMSHTESYKTIAHKLHAVSDPNKEEYIQLKRALDHFELRVDPNILPELKINYPILPVHFGIRPNLTRPNNNQNRLD